MAVRGNLWNLKTTFDTTQSPFRLSLLCALARFLEMVRVTPEGNWKSGISSPTRHFAIQDRARHVASYHPDFGTCIYRSRLHESPGEALLLRRVSSSRALRE